MAAFSPAILTKKGIALLAKAQIGLTSIEFTRAAVGDGEYENDEDIKQLLSLKSQKQDTPITNVHIINESTVYLKFVVSNLHLLHGYYMREVGIFAKDPDEGEILYSISIANENKWDFLPAYNNLIPSTVVMEFYTEVNNSSDVHIEVIDGVYALEEDLNMHITNFDNPHNVTALQVPYQSKAGIVKSIQYVLDNINKITNIEIDAIIDSIETEDDETELFTGNDFIPENIEIVTEEDIQNVLNS